MKHITAHRREQTKKLKNLNKKIPPKEFSGDFFILISYKNAELRVLCFANAEWRVQNAELWCRLCRQNLIAGFGGADKPLTKQIKETGIYINRRIFYNIKIFFKNLLTVLKYYVRMVERFNGIFLPFFRKIGKKSVIFQVFLKGSRQ